jgi:hypothetical protein
MRTFSVNAIVITGPAGALSIPAIRISGNNFGAGIGA